MTTVRSLVDEVSALLNDAEPDFANIRWTRDEVREYATDAALQVATLRPELFEHTETLMLSPGERQSLPDDTMFERIDGTLNDKGELMGRPYRADATVSRVASRWFGDWSSRCACCVEARTYVLESWTFDPAIPSTFFVAPPVPPGKPVRVLAVLSRVPAATDEDDAIAIDPRFHNALIEFMLYRAFSKDEDSQASVARSERHKQHFYEMLGLQRQAESRFYTGIVSPEVRRGKPD
ncbi:hypothetical protein KEH57_09530 [Burkholderia cenocepacia]|uniref:phage adaptor protein n=1 Tax=Burkholderia cenocepacia TaxID=95486 RepID=UPI001BAC0DB5|nr:DUF6682 family protein [Burkholderia cenocepacia]QUO23831.1 hypothetical protein KEH57_09530 [Burkholderia cenocepacia]